MAEQNSKPHSFLGTKSFRWLAGIALLGLIAIGLSRFTASKARVDSQGEHLTFSAKRGPLRISVIESGTIEAREQVIIKNEVEGKTSILFLITEGTRVKKGDLLVELDGSSLVDEKIDQQIRVQNAEAAYIGAREELAVVKNQAQSDVDKAQLGYDFSKEDLKKYLEGDFPNALKQAESQITLAKEELTRATEKWEWSKKLYDEKYLSQTELNADELTVKKKNLDLDLAHNNLELLKNFTHKRTLAQLESDVKQAEMALERTDRKAKADVVQAEANLGAKKAEFERQKDKLSKIEAQIEKTKIYAPADGLVIHATSAQKGGFRRSVEPLQEGQIVVERQELIHLPTTAAANVTVSIHEAHLDKIRVGLPVKVTVDALPGQVFYGKVANISPLPDARSAWLNPDLKVYDTEIQLDRNSEALRTGMSCKAEIIIEQYKEATYIPVQAVLRIGGQPTVYLFNGQSLEPRKVEIGLDNDRMVRIIAGLQPGEVVSLTPPLAAAALDPAAYSDKITKDFALPNSPGSASGEAKREGVQSPDATGAARSVLGRRDEGPPTGPGAPRAARGGGNPTPEQRERRQQFLKGLSQDERERLQKMSPEERREFVRQKMAQQ